MCCVGLCASDATVLLIGGDYAGVKTRDLPYCDLHWAAIRSHYTRREYRRL